MYMMQTPFPSSTILLLATLLLCSTIITISTSTNGANQTDMVALLKFKEEIVQNLFNALASWNSCSHFCEWEGVTCGSRHKRVIVLDLQSQSLTGTISPYIGNLTFLRLINLQDNNFQGVIPQEIGRLSQLQDLALANNSLVGTIPRNVSLCSNLINLRLSNNRLQGEIPVELGFLSNLVIFAALENNLSGRIPASLGNLSSLQTLSLPRNYLDGSIPESLGKLSSLRVLSLGPNNLSGTVPPSLYNISSITQFSLPQNRLKGTLPRDIGFTLPIVQNLFLGGNKFIGPIPVSLFNSSKLQQLNLPQNNFIGGVTINPGGLQAISRISLGYNYNLGSGKPGDLNFLHSLINCSNLGFLGLNDDNFGGTLPNSIGNLSSKLSVLLLGGNQISGSIPKEIGNLFNLTLLGMDRNLLTGTIPTAIEKLNKLVGLSLLGNRLSGEIPSTLGNLSQLSELYFSDNTLQGSIPAALGECQSLQTLDLSVNSLTGSIPKEVIGISSLSIYLDLSNNVLLGSLPSEVGQLKNLGVLDISDNRLEGEIPIQLGDCVMLEQLYLEGNFFRGTIPQSLKSLRGIQNFDISLNNLSGGIPNFLGMLPSLQKLNLSFNRLEGDVPTEGIFKNVSAVSVVNNYKLCGGIPELQLTLCSTYKSKNNGTHRRPFKLIIVLTSVILCFILISVILFFFWRKKPRKEMQSSPSFAGNLHLRVSYDDLHKATGGFSSANLIGAGNFGFVYKGVLNEEEKFVAVKVLNLQQRGASKSFIAECEALSKIRHRNLLKIVTSCSSIDFQGNDFKALVYEYMSNGNLDDWLHPSALREQEPRFLNLGQRLSIAIDVASALSYLHHQNSTPIVHCDLKPSNILLDNDLTAHVGDFGLAKFLCGSSSKFSIDLTTSSAINGTIGYVAPEYATGREVSTQGDVYSYGILLLEMFTGKRPTDEMFRDDQTLHSFYKKSLAAKSKEIVDPHLLLGEGVYGINDQYIGNRNVNSTEIWTIRVDKVEECMASILQIGIACSTESPSDRIGIDEAVMKLNDIKDELFDI